MRAALFLFALLLAVACGDRGTAEGTLALEEGNRQFENGEIDSALEAYVRGWTGDGSDLDGILAYNAGTCALRLGRLPEALLWYRRAQAATPRDPWVRDNLAATRGALGTPATEAPLPWALWTTHGRWLALTGVLLAWTVLGLLLLVRRSSRQWLTALALLSCAFFTASLLVGRVGPRPAVLLDECPGLAAGTEVWVQPAQDGWRVAGKGEVLCPAGAVGLVEP